MGRIMRIFGLVLAIGLLVPAAVVEAAEVDDVRYRAESLYSSLIDKNVRHYRVREDLQSFFPDAESLSNYLIRLARDFEKAGIGNYQPKSFVVEEVEVDSSYGVAEVTVRLKGDWFLWFKRSFERTDQWRLEGDQWMVEVPPLRNLDFK